jgi:uncharacterized protein (DUF2252 family)
MSFKGAISFAKRKKPVRRLPPLGASSALSARLAEGKALRKKIPRKIHGPWKPSPHRPDPVELLIESSKTRIPELVPLRHGRMVQSPFSFYRGAAAIMAADLARTPITGIFTQLCGDCHLLNFGGYATPERRMIFDINDFDETLPGPWEWDLKRLVTSFVIASRHNGFSKSGARDAALACARSYRKQLAEFAEMRALEVWYARMDLETILEDIEEGAERRRMEKQIARVVSRDVIEDDYPKLVSSSKGKFRIRDNPPLIYHPPDALEKQFSKNAREARERYRESLSDDRRMIFDRFELKDIAMKVVGVGSVGTWCGIMLYMASDRDPLFLQAKEARASVFEPYLGKSPYGNHGERVVVGQRIMQSASDIFLGWSSGKKGRHFYIRQLRDMKIKPQVEIFQTEQMLRFAKYCGWTLARAHAKSGDAARISGYLGRNDLFDEAVADFGVAYADQNEKDHDALVKAVRKRRVKVFLER